MRRMHRTNKAAPLPLVHRRGVGFVVAVVLAILRAAPSLANRAGGFVPPMTADVDDGNMQAAQGIAKRAWGKVEKVTTSAPFEVYRLYMRDDGKFPNNPRYPLLLYKSAFSGGQAEGERAITEGGAWTSPWAWGVFPYHHYHTTAWELLLCVRGHADLQLGGGTGPTARVSHGDLVLIPPGFAHKQLSSAGGFTLLGSYPTSGWTGSIDTVTGAPTAKQRGNIADCPVPGQDPLFGLDVAELCE